MEKILLTSLLFSFLLLGACHKTTKDKPASSTFNPTLKKIIDAHGGMQNWEKEKTLTFKTGDQTQTVDLQSRNIKITAPNFSMGSKNDMVWIKQDSAFFKGSPRFYHSLMFYFHTMPFVFADPGINYQTIPNKTIKHTTFGGLKMSFNSTTGDAPNDQYILYYHPDTYKMEWLAYSSTYYSQKKSDHFNMIHYTNWRKTGGLLLPTRLQWYDYQKGNLGAPSGDPRIIKDATLSHQAKPGDFYAIPKGATVDSARGSSSAMPH